MSLATYHSFSPTPNPCLKGHCERCGHLELHPTHLSLLDRVEALRELYLEEHISIEDLVEKLPNGWCERDDDPNREGRHLVQVLVSFMAEYQCEKCDEPELRTNIASTR